MKVDVDESEEVATKLDSAYRAVWRCHRHIPPNLPIQLVAWLPAVSAMPTFMFFKAGKRVHIFKGANEAELTTSVTAHK